MGPPEKQIQDEDLFLDLIGDPKFCKKFPDITSLKQCGEKQLNKLEEARQGRLNKLYSNYWGDTL